MTRADRAPAGRSLTSRIVAAFLGSNFSLLLILLSLGMGAAALLITPREEDPQIVVPFIDVFVDVPGSTADETQKLAAEPLERLFLEIPGVEHVYSVTHAGKTMVTVRFEVGEDREKALVNVYNKIQSNLDRVPPQVSGWLVKPVEIDDVPILTATLYAEDGDASTDLVRFADEIAARLQEVADVSRVDVVGGQRRTLRVQLDGDLLRARAVTALEVQRALGAASQSRRAGVLTSDDHERVVEVGPFLRSKHEIEDLVVAMRDGRPVAVRDIATVLDGPAEPDSYTAIAFGPAARAVQRGTPVAEAAVDGRRRPAVTIAVSKRKGTNAVVVASHVLDRLAELGREILPPSVGYQITRNYGETANEKVGELVGHLLIAVASIVVLLGGSLGWRSAIIVALAVPLTLAVTLFGDLVVGYTINRVTLFALILSLGLLVDDPIVDVENIHRHLSLGRRSPFDATLEAVDEVRPPTILATFTVIVSFLPLFFVTGMMGPYMRPMPFNVPVAMLLSLIIAFTITPWAAYHVLGRHVRPHEGGGEHGPREGVVLKTYRAVAGTLLRRRWAGVCFLAAVGLALVSSVALAGFRLVPMKMLPFDNKSEFQIVVDAPEGTTLERTERAVGALARAVLTTPEVIDVATYTGLASPHDFNGLVRHYFLRRGSNVADLRVDLLPRHERGRQSHEIVLAVRSGLEQIAERHGVRIKVVETPPGPPVLAGVVAEVYAPLSATPEKIEAFARNVEQRFERIPYVRDVDTFIEDRRPRLHYEVLRRKAALRGVSTAAVAHTLGIALSGLDAGALHAPHERQSLPIRLELPRAERSSEGDLLDLAVRSESGQLVPLSDLVHRVEDRDDPVLLSKDLRPVQYVTGEAVGKSPVDAVFALQDDLAEDPPPDGYSVELAGEGEWQITVDVFRDMGIAFAGALAGIYVLLVAQIGSFAISGLIMLAIPLTVIGIFPGFWALNVLFSHPTGGFDDPIFFTATGMIGMIALAGIVVRNSIILIDFIKRNEAAGAPTAEACLEAGVVRLRPILLTAGAAVLGAWVIVFDPIFSGLAWSFVFGIVASTAFTVLVIPLVYALTRRPPAPGDP